MFHIYGKPLHEIWLYMGIGLFLWSVISIGAWHHFQIWRRINQVLLIGAIAVILYMTVYGREGSVRIIIWQPLYSFKEAKIIPEYYRTLLMNVFLFFPFGLVLPFALPKTVKHKYMTAIMIACILSIIIEASQFVFSLGRSETDDVIMNTIGAAIGAIAYCIQKHFNTLRCAKFYI